MARDPAAFWDRLAPRYAAMKIADPAAWEATLDRVRAHLETADHPARRAQRFVAARRPG